LLKSDGPRRAAARFETSPVRLDDGSAEDVRALSLLGELQPRTLASSPADVARSMFALCVHIG